jgi:NAD(P)-dependent dehydrogenase (short-subunit alcohol dehydrogenase family)
MAQASPGPEKAYIIAGPTSGIGYRTALQLARHGTVILVGRNREKARQGTRVDRARGGRRNQSQTKCQRPPISPALT